MKVGVSMEFTSQAVEQAAHSAGQAVFMLFGILIVAELLYLGKFTNKKLDFKEYTVSILSMLGYLGSKTIFAAISILALGQVLAPYTFFHIDSYNVPLIIALVLGVEFCYYTFHRICHRVRIFWAHHSAHHSVHDYVLANAGRLGWFQSILGHSLFFTPLLLLGFEAQVLLNTYIAISGYNALVHTDVFEKLPFEKYLSYILVTPSSHRAHHGTNPEYIDTNYGAMFSIYDHLLGTYQPEIDEVEIKYGLVGQEKRDYNLFNILVGPFINLAKEAYTQKGIVMKFKVFFMPPEWRPEQKEVQGNKDLDKVS